MQPNSRMAMFVVVVVEEPVGEVARVFKAPEAFGKRWAVLECFEGGFGEGIVVADVGSAVAPRHAQVHHQLTDRFGAHGPAAIGVDGERVASNTLGENRVFNELLSELRVFVRGHQPVEDVATEDVEDHVEVVEETAPRTAQFGDVPTPNFIGLRSEQFGLLLRGVRALSPTIARGAALRQQSVHGGGRTEVDPLIEGARVNLVDREVAVDGFVEQRQHRVALARTQRVGRGGANRGHPRHFGFSSSVVRRANSSEQRAGLLHPDQCHERVVHRAENLVNDYSVSALLERVSKSACAFPTMSRANRVRSSSCSSRWFFLVS